MQDVEAISKENGLVLYQDEIYAIIDVDHENGRVLIEKGEYEGPGVLISRYVQPEQLEAIEYGE